METLELLSLRFRQTGCDDRFLQAIHVAREAVGLTTDGDKGRVVRLGNFGRVSTESCNKTGNTERLQEAIRIGGGCLAATPDDHPDKALRCFNLADRLQLRCFESQSTMVLEEVISLYRLTLHEFRASMFLRVEAGYSLMQACVSKGDLTMPMRLVPKPSTVYRFSDHFHCKTLINSVKRANY